MTTGYVFYDGPSVIDGSPIIGIAVLHSENGKTGDMVQTYILRADQTPLDAIASGDDASICGDCTHRGSETRARTCYVNVAQSVQSVFYAWVRGAYPLVSPLQLSRLVSGRMVRLGSYGDPAAIPAKHWRSLISRAEGHTGYTHQWRKWFSQGLRSLVMASADTELERDIARAMQWRTFRVRTKDSNLGQREIMCPASDEAGNRRQCITCKACDGAARGSNQASIAIIVHGSMSKHFQSA